ncbi:hypothetical protein [Arthrobacter sp. Br18]|uniref:hypothetical protein n=1 Tax=Arthrobacter sp. Br18 TaxID=1312954 RepID=UPI0009DD52D1|nr:hypothetical protein [Arthrobacter sp. Br18]
MDSVHAPGTHGSHGVPRRRPSPAVYRRRRLVAAVLALLVVALLVAGMVMVIGLFSRDDGDPAAGGAVATASTPAAAPTAAAPTDAPGASASAEPAPTASEPEPTATGEPEETTEPEEATDPAEASEPECDPAEIVVEARTDAPAYAPGQEPVLSLIVRNESETACAVNVGTSQMEFLVADPADRVFSSADCQQAPQDLPRVLEPGAEEVATLAWERTRTTPGCESVEAVPEGGTYALTTRLGDLTSGATSFVLEG